jgi:hypothetical protein
MASGQVSGIFDKRLHALPSHMALPPHILASRQKTERKRREKSEQKKKIRNRKKDCSLGPKMQ